MVGAQLRAEWHGIALGAGCLGKGVLMSSTGPLCSSAHTQAAMQLQADTHLLPAGGARPAVAVGAVTAVRLTPHSCCTGRFMPVSIPSTDNACQALTNFSAGMNCTSTRSSPCSRTLEVLW